MERKSWEGDRILKGYVPKIKVDVEKDKIDIINSKLISYLEQ